MGDVLDKAIFDFFKRIGRPNIRVSSIQETPSGWRIDFGWINPKIVLEESMTQIDFWCRDNCSDDYKIYPDYVILTDETDAINLYLAFS